MREIRLPDGKTAFIRNAQKSDARGIIEYINIIVNETDYLTFGPGQFTKSITEEEQYIDNISRQNNSLLIVAEVNNLIVGNLNFLGNVKPRTRHAGEFGVSVLKEYWKKGIGEALINYLIDWCRESKIIRKINLRVRTDNYPAVRLYQKLNFIEEGTIQREFQVNGKFYDSIHMGLIID